MKIKRIMSIVALALTATLVATGAVVKKSPDQVKIYINPGHGAYDGNCRPMGTVKHGAFNSSKVDTTGFFESNTNLWKALALFYKLKDYGVRNTASSGVFSSANKNQGVVMSHNKCGINRDLADIRAEVEEYKPDVFISIHSNASPDGSIGSNENYPLLIYRGEDYKPNASPAFGDATFDYVNGSYALGQAIWPHLASIAHEPYTEEWKTQWEKTPLDPTANVRGDVDFMYYLQRYINGNTSYTTSSARGSGTTNSYSGKKYYGYYGVMKHGYVGILSEGYMHSYYPSVNRHMNRDVCEIEGIAYAHGIADYFGWEKEKVGYIYGIVRDRNTTFSHTYYIPNQNSDDIYKPLNNVTVSLYKDGKLVDKYVTDDEYNGAFVFKNLEPGDYTLDYSCAGYAPASEALKATVVTVKANEISYPKAFLSQQSYSPSSGVTMSTTPVTTHSCSGWYGGSSSNKIYPRQIAVSNDVVYLIMVGGSRISYWNAATGADGSFSYGSAGANGHGICTDDEGNLIFASSPGYSKRMQQVTVLPKSSGPGVVVSTTNAKNISLSGKYNTVLSGKSSTGTTSNNTSGITNVIRASGNCYNGTGALWLTNGREVVKIPIVNGVAQNEVVYDTPLTDSSFSGSFGGSHNEDWAKESSFFPYADGKYVMINRNGMFLCTLNGSEVDGFEYVENTWYPYNSSDIEYIGGHEIIAHQASEGLTRNGKITVIDRTTGATLASAINAYGSAATLPTDAASVNAWCEFDIIDNNTLALYTYVPNNGLAKYIISYSSSPEVACENIKAVGSIDEAYNQNIKVTWTAPKAWETTPDNYLVKYKTVYTNANGQEVESEWVNAGMTEVNEFVHQGVTWTVDKGVVCPLNYKYKIIPNFNCYDGPVAESNAVAIDFVAPSPELQNFAVGPVFDNSGNVKQYDANAQWLGVNVGGNTRLAVSGYKVELWAEEDTERKNPVAQFTFAVNEAKYFGSVDLSTGVGAMLNAQGEAIAGLTYAKDNNNITFDYVCSDIDVLVADKSAVRPFAVEVTAIYGDSEGNSYTTKANATATPDYRGELTGAEEMVMFDAVRVYPVPATSLVTIESPEAIVKVEIYSLTGALVKAEPGNEVYQMNLSVADLTPGTYILVVNNTPIKLFKK